MIFQEKYFYSHSITNLTASNSERAPITKAIKDRQGGKPFNVLHIYNAGDKVMKTTLNEDDGQIFFVPPSSIFNISLDDEIDFHEVKVTNNEAVNSTGVVTLTYGRVGD